MRIRSLLLLGVAVVLAPLSEAKGRAAPNPFAGRFIGDVPNANSLARPSWSISIVGSGKVTGEKYVDAGVYLASGSFTGTLDKSNGRMSITGSGFVVIWGSVGRFFINSAGTATPNADGNLVVAFDSGETFIWTRQ
jgi:hypothetical protein